MKQACRRMLGALGWALVVVIAGSGGSAHAEGTRFYTLEGFGALLDGNPDTTAISEDGAVRLPPTVVERFSDAAETFNAAALWGPDVAVGRVRDGDLAAVAADGTLREVFKPEEPLVTALVGTRRGLYLAAGPSAKVYRVGRDGQATVAYEPEAEFVWDMVEGPDGAIYAVTGDPGQVLRLAPGGEIEVLADLGQRHLRSVLYHRDLGLFVGGGERGVLYRCESVGKSPFHALHDTGHVEITSMVIDGGHIYVAGVTGAEDVIKADLMMLKSTSKSSKSSSRSKTSTVRSQLVRVAMDGTAEAVAGSNDEAIFSVARPRPGLLYIATGSSGREDPRGRLYSMDTEARSIALLHQSASRRVTHLLHGKKEVVAVAGGGARIFTLRNALAPEGVFYSAPFDAGITSRFGLLQLFGTLADDETAVAAVRTGQTAEPDESWSVWSKPVPFPGATLQVTPGRYMQVRLTLSRGQRPQQTPEIYRVRVAYLRQNMAPFVRDIGVLPKGIVLLPIPKEEPKAKTVMLGAGGVSAADDAAAKGAEAAKNKLARLPRARQVYRPGALTIRWLAEDPNQDELSYALSVRRADRADPWRPLEDGLKYPFFTLQSSQFADGYYQFQVKASDAGANPDGVARDDTRRSRAVLIDNSAPRLDPFEVRVKGRHADIRVNVLDSVGPLIDASYALDAAEPDSVLPVDGVLDGPGESFLLRFRELAPGPHTVTFRVLDEARNEGFGEARFMIR